MKAVIQYVVELLVRFFSKKPLFFTILQIIMALMIGATAIITNLVNTGALQPADWVITVFTGKDAWLPYLIALITAQLPVKNDAVKDAKVQQLVGKKSK